MKTMRGGLLLGVAACLAVMLLVGPATPVSAQVQDVIRPDTPLDPLAKPKVSFNHDNRPEPVDHDGNPVENPNPIGWLWHPGEDYRHVAGIKFKLKYDPYEVNILGIQNTFGGVAGALNGHYNFDPPAPLAPSEGVPVPASSLPGVIQGTVWLHHFIANASGIDLAASQEIPIFDLLYQPRHTSHVSQAQFNSEVDIRVSELRPIFHIAQEDERHLSSVWVPRHVGPDETNIPVPASEMLWEHKGSTWGVIVPNSQTVFPGPLPANSTVPAPSGMHVDAKIPPSAWVHTKEPMVLTAVDGQQIVLEPSQYRHVDKTIQLSGVVMHASSFIVGAPVLGAHVGLGIDHVPEPATLALLAMGSLAGLTNLVLRRRRRRAA